MTPPEPELRDGKVVLELDLARLAIPDRDDGHITLGDFIVGRAVDALIGHPRHGVAWRTSFQMRVEQLRDEEIRGRLGPLIEQAVAASIQPTGEYGSPRGPAVPLQEHVVTLARAELAKRSSPGSSRGGDTLIERLVREQVEGVLRKELAAELEAAKQQVKEAVRQEGARLLEETITRLAERKSS